MAEKIINIDLSNELPKKQLLKILKNELDDIYIFDIIESYVQLAEDGKYVQSVYQREYLEAYIKGFLLRVKEIRDDKSEYNGIVNNEEIRDALDILKEQRKMVEEEMAMESNFFRIYEVVSLYTTFIVEESIHLVGTLFPGGFRVKFEGNIYYCPVKEKQKDNPGAVCRFCIAKQDEDV